MGIDILDLVREDFGLEQNSGRWYRSVKHNSLVVDALNQKFYWNSRGISGGVYEYYRFVRNQSPPKFLGGDSRILGRLLAKNSYGDTHPSSVVVYPKLVDVFWKMGLDDRQYWYDRLLTDATIDLFKLGYTGNGFYSIPVYRKNSLYNIQCRPEDKTKNVFQMYKRAPSLFNSSILSNVKEVIFTEGIVDAILLTQLGFPAVSKNTGASYWYSGWALDFFNVDRIYLLFDNDSAGNFGMKRGAEILGFTRCYGYSFREFKTKGYDVVDFFRDGYTKKDFEFILKKARRVV